MVAAPKDKKEGKKHSKKREKKDGSKHKDEAQKSALLPPGAKKDESVRSVLKAADRPEAQRTWARSPMPETKPTQSPAEKPEGDPKKQLPNCITCFPDVITYQPENKKQVRNLEIKNKGDRPVMFKMKSTSAGLFRMRPIHFLLRAGESKIIKMSYKGCAERPNLKDRFTVVMAYPPGNEANVKLMWTQQAYVEKLADCTHRKYVKILFDGYDVPDKSKLAEPEPAPAPPPPAPAPEAPAAAPPPPPPQQPQQPCWPGMPGMPGGGGGIVYVIYNGDQNKQGGGGPPKKEEKEEEEKDEKDEKEGDDEDDDEEDDDKKKK